jgi:multidrug resistance efflux pump
MEQITIVALLDGVVYQINAHLGGLVDQNTEILNIVRSGKILIVALVRPDVLQKLKVGDTISFYVSVYPEKYISGKGIQGNHQIYKRCCISRYTKGKSLY